jgi:hypothetical protein
MAYSNAIPQANDQISVSQSALLANFQEIQTLIGVDHSTFNTVNAGQHNKVTFPVQAAAPVVPAGTIGMFSLASILTGQNELNVTDSAGFTFPITANSVDPFTGWSYLSSGLIIRWGTVIGSGVVTKVFPVAANQPVFTAVLAVLVTPYEATVGDSNFAVKVIDYTNLQFRVYIGSRTQVNIPVVARGQYLAIGY